MAKLARKNLKLFGSTGTSDNFGKFGSQAAGTPLTTKDVETIQGLDAWDKGIQEAVWPVNKAPFLEDVNAWFYVHSYEVAYTLQEGIPEWNADTTYFVGSIVKKTGTFELYGSLANDNLGNALPSAVDNANWKYLTPDRILDGGVTVGAIPKVSAVSPGEVVDSAISEDASDVILAKPLKFADASVQTTAAQPVTTQNVVTGSRAQNIVYHNTGTTPMWVSVTGGAGGASIAAYTDANPSPSTKVGQVSGSTSSPDLQLMFIVLPGNYYKVTGGASITTWTEWA